MLQLTTDIAMGFNQRKPPDRTVCVAVDLSAAFDTVCHNKLMSKINRSHLSPATSRWLSCYLRVRQAKTCIRGVKSPSRKVIWATGVNIPDMEDSLNSYLEEITAYLKDNFLLISAPKSSVILFTPDTH